jgi:hypothetical protein
VCCLSECNTKKEALGAAELYLKVRYVKIQCTLGEEIPGLERRVGIVGD